MYWILVSILIIITVLYLFTCVEGFASPVDIEFTKWKKWTTKFCIVWNNVIDHAVKTYRPPITADEYIDEITNSEKKEFPRCKEEKPTLESLPKDTSEYNNALQYMLEQTAKIKKNTAIALQGKPVETFSDISEAFEGEEIEAKKCTKSGNQIVCVFGEDKDTEKAILNRLKRLNADIPSLEKTLQAVQQQLDDLNQIKKRAQSGEIIKDIKLPKTSSGDVKFS